MSGSFLKANARKLIFENFPRLFFITLLYIIIASVVSWLTLRLPGNIDIQGMYDRLSAGELPSITLIYSNFRLIGVFLAVLLSLFQPVLDVGFISFCLKTGRRQDTQYTDIFNGFIYFVKVMAIFIVTFTFTLLWSLLFIFPGIVAAYRYRLAYYILLDDPKKGVFQCINESKTVMFGAKLDLLIIDISFLGWYILDITVALLLPLPFAFPILSVWIAPYAGLTRVGFYQQRLDALTA
ncbi:MAG: DUF975 family protein [Oscillospiraceae bacterium]|nr:DUF975 family protein [Oscillospiraceae bacterium]